MWVVAQTQASSLLSVFIKGLAFLMCCKSDLTNIIHYFPLSLLSLPYVVQDGKAKIQNIRSGWSNTQHWLAIIQLLIDGKRATEKCIAFVCLLLTFHGQSSCHRQWVLNFFCAGDYFIRHMEGVVLQVNKNISSLEITGENTVAAPWMKCGQHTKSSPRNIIWGGLNRGWSGMETAARFCQNPCTGGSLVVLSSW